MAHEMGRGVYESSPGAVNSYHCYTAWRGEPSLGWSTPVLDGINSLTNAFILLIFY